MNLAALDLHLLVAFEALYEARSVTRAAERLGIGQPAMSASLAKLRDIFGDPLFVRAAGSMQPTLKADRLGPTVSAKLADLRAVLEENRPFDARTAARTFTIASTDYTSITLLPALIADLRKHAPAIDLRVIGYDKDDIVRLIGRGEIDLALGVFRNPPERAVRKRLCAEFFVGVARRGHPDVAAGCMTLDRYAAQPHALVSVRRDAAGVIDAALAEAGLTRRIALTIPHMLVLPELLAHSDMVSAVPNRIAQPFIVDGLQTFRLPLDVPAWNIEMLWNVSVRADRAHTWLRERIGRIARTI